MTISPKRQNIPVSNTEATLTRMFAVLAVAAAGMAALLAWLSAAGHDQIWFLLMARRWLGGAQLYGPEAFDSNPPGIVWLSAVPVLLGKLLHLRATAAGKLLVTLAESGASAVAVLWLRKAWRRERTYEFFALLFAAIVLFYVVPARDFGQRDHMTAFLILPYVLAAAVEWPAQKWTALRVLAGLMAGAGICLKPHHALVPLVVELGLLAAPLPGFPHAWTARIRHLCRPEPVLILLTGAVFLSAIRSFAPLYFTTALPVVRDTYWAIGHLSFTELAVQGIEVCILGLIAAGLYMVWTPRKPVVRTLLIAAAASSAAYFVQRTGWYYQQLPAIALFGVALMLLLLDRLGQRPYAVPRWTVPSIATLSLLAVFLTAHFSGYPFTFARAYTFTEPDPAFFASLKPGTPVATLTTSVEEAMMPVERYELTWAQRTNNLWLLPAILRDEQPETVITGKPQHRMLPPERLAALDAKQHRWMVDDLGRWHPRLVLVERCQVAEVHCQELEDRRDDLLAWFLHDPAFASVWKSYRYAGTRGNFDAYTLAP